MIHIFCKQCGEWEIVSPGHPAVRLNPDTQQHEFFDRTIVPASCKCSDADTPLAFTFMGPINTGVAN